MLDSIRSRLTVTFLALAVVPLFVVGMVITWQSLKYQQQQTLIREKSTAKHIAVNMEQSLLHLEQDIEILEQLGGLSALDPLSQQNRLGTLLNYQPAFTELILLSDKKDEIVKVAVKQLLEKKMDFLLSQANLESEETYYSPIWFDNEGESYLTIIKPLAFSSNGEDGLILLANISIREIWLNINSTDFDIDGCPFIVDDEQQIITYCLSDSQSIGKTFIRPINDGLNVGLQSSRSLLVSEPFSFGMNILWVVVEQPILQAVSWTFSVILIMIISILVGLVIASLLANIALKYFVQPLDELVMVADAIESGDLGRRVEKAGIQEIDNLAVAFNRMTTRLRRTMGELESWVDELAATNITLQDEIKQREYMESELNKSEQWFRSAIELMPIPVVITHKQTSAILYANAASGPTFDTTGDHLLGKFMNDFFYEPDDQVVITQMLNTQHYLSNHEVKFKTIDGASFWVTISAQIFVFNNDGAVLAAFYNVTERKQAEMLLKGYSKMLEKTVKLRTSELASAIKEAEDARQAAETANRSKSVFLANMSHELRTPLNAILGFTQVMSRDKTLTKEQQENVNIISRSGEHLLNLINDVLEMSKIEAGRTLLHITNFDLSRSLSDLQEIFYMRASEKGLQLIFEKGDSVPQFIRTDEGKLRQILINLIGNAIKFTIQGQVKISVSYLDLQDEHRLVFEVADTGPGISEDEYEALFEAFVQTQDGQQVEGGTGLGLAISQQFVHLLGGDIQVESELNYGTKFIFDISVELTEQIQLPAEEVSSRVVGLAPDQPTYRLLIVEDKWANRKLLIKLLVPLGFEVREAENGQEAVKIAEEWHPHLVWMDMRMPIMDGYEATRRIKSAPYGKDITIIALTASAFKEDREAILSIGCDDFVRKPFYEAEIFQKIAQHLPIEYVYEKVADIKEEKTDEENNITWTMLTEMPANWLANLYQAALAADSDTILILLRELHLHNAEMAEMLSTMVNDFRFDLISNEIEKLQEDMNP